VRPPPAFPSLCLILTLVITVLAGCSSEREVLALLLDPSALTPPSDLRALNSTEAAVRGITAIMASNFGVPAPDRVTVYVYAGRPAFQEGLILDAHLAPVHAAELSDFAIGIGQRRQIFLKEDGHQTQREWLRLIAHEFAHVSQIELAGGEGRAEQWLAEGMAEWLAYGTLEHLGLDSMDRRRRMAISGLSNHATLIQAHPDLERYGTPRGFTAWHLREGSLPTYQLAFLMADYLIEDQGLDRVTAYFASFSHSQDRHRNFRNAFGGTLAEFETDVLTHLRARVSVIAPDCDETAPGDPQPIDHCNAAARSSRAREPVHATIRSPAPNPGSALLEPRLRWRDPAGPLSLAPRYIAPSFALTASRS
jgi:hypothetical protein